MVPSSLSQQYLQHIQQQFSQTCQLLSEQGYGRLLIAAGDINYHFRDDGDYPFKLNPYFASWLNLVEAAGSWLIIDCQASKPTLLHYFPEDIWHQPAPLDDALVQQAFEVVSFGHPKELPQWLTSNEEKLAYIGPAQACIQDLPNCTTNCESLLTAIDYYRAYKSDYEQACIRQANEAAVLGHRAAAEAFYRGESEYQIHMAYLQATQQLDNDQPYNSIIALNEHAAVLHYPHKSRQQPASPKSFLIDAGVSVAGYAADISRSYAYQPGVFADLIVAMDSLQQNLVASLAVGLSYVDVHIQAHRALAAILLEFKLVQGSVDSLLAQGVTSVFFPHGLGHYLGIQVHDRGGWLTDPQGGELKAPQAHPYLRLTRSIEANQVFTIEPGLYFIEPILQQAQQDARGAAINWDAVTALKPWGGIRIEDNILMAETGAVNLTRLAGLV
ncbi:Xaa-Pro dipeptidase [Dasania marina]|uniref:Xaa-Pro dipeptidase n=1 Tax=Dasania marina TaxID=471499 RepID=UPI0030DB863C